MVKNRRFIRGVLLYSSVRQAMPETEKRSEKRAQRVEYDIRCRPPARRNETLMPFVRGGVGDGDRRWQKSLIVAKCRISAMNCTKCENAHDRVLRDVRCFADVEVYPIDHRGRKLVGKSW